MALDVVDYNVELT